MPERRTPRKAAQELNGRLLAQMNTGPATGSDGR
jgi:hypothetical protein